MCNACSFVLKLSSGERIQGAEQLGQSEELLVWTARGTQGGGEGRHG